MRLWHQALIHYLPNKQLLGQHRECCALRGLGWGKKHSIVDYVFRYSRNRLFFYHKVVMNEMSLRRYNVDSSWKCYNYHGKTCGYSESNDEEFRVEYDRLRSTCCKVDCDFSYSNSLMPIDFIVYSEEHNNKYLIDCVRNLRSKNAELVNGKSLAEFELLAILGGY